MDTPDHHFLDRKMSLFVPCSPDGACLQRPVFTGISGKRQKFPSGLSPCPPLLLFFLQNAALDVRNLNLIVVEARVETPYPTTLVILELIASLALILINLALLLETLCNSDHLRCSSLLLKCCLSS
jgi:hypothetical protein